MQAMAKRKRETKNESSETTTTKTRKVSTAWNQDDTEALCNLLLSHGVGGILNKSTNVGTKEKKELEWQTITTHFNAISRVI